VNGRNKTQAWKDERTKAALNCTGRANQTMSNMMREKLETNAVKQPALSLVLILISFHLEVSGLW
jgi:hypothetical protein